MLWKKKTSINIIDKYITCDSVKSHLTQPILRKYDLATIQIYSSGIVKTIKFCQLATRVWDHTNV